MISFYCNILISVYQFFFIPVQLRSDTRVKLQVLDTQNKAPDDRRICFCGELHLFFKMGRQFFPDVFPDLFIHPDRGDQLSVGDPKFFFVKVDEIPDHVGEKDQAVVLREQIEEFYGKIVEVFPEGVVEEGAFFLFGHDRVAEGDPEFGDFLQHFPYQRGIPEYFFEDVSVFGGEEKGLGVPDGYFAGVHDGGMIS